MMQTKRLAHGGRINRNITYEIRFDGRLITAFQGDTLGSAFIANDGKIIGRSFKYHRPRGIYAAGVEEPNGMVHLRSGSRHEPNAKATVVEAYDGLEASGQNAWPSVQFDLNALNQLLAPFISAGFYYKTFIGPFQGTRFWMLCEQVIRKAAGMGKAYTRPDPDEYEKVNAHCDVLVIGAGPAGLAAAVEAGQAGARVILVEQDFLLGGSLLSLPVGDNTDGWLENITALLKTMNNVRILKRSTVFGAYEQDVYGIVERVWDHVPVPPRHQPRQRYWQIRTKQTVLATGAIERPLVFGGNDKPGVMLASSVRTYINRYAVLPGKNVVVTTNNDSAYSVALDLVKAGAKVVVIDVRKEIPIELEEPLKALGVNIYLAHGVLCTIGLRCVKAVKIVPIDESGQSTDTSTKLECDLLALSGGWAPVIHLWSQRSQKPVFDLKSGSFIPTASSLKTMKFAGSVTAKGDLMQAIAQGEKTGREAAEDSGYKTRNNPAPKCNSQLFADDWVRGLSSIWLIAKADGTSSGKVFIDLQHDVSLTDIDLAYREGYVSVEHLKRYTTTGMATDQGKLSNVNALARVAQLQSLSIPNVGTTTFRPPFTPVVIGAIVGREYGLHFHATRHSPVHDWHVNNGAILTEARAWKRPWYYPQNDENLPEAYCREASHVRKYVGIVDVSTLGKIAVQGPDAADFLNRIYVNAWKKLGVGRIRYGVMLRDDGFVMDDGATARLGDNDYFMTTTTANAAKILSNMEHLLQSAWTDLKVHVTSVTDQYGAFAIAGPNARDVLLAIGVDVDLSNSAFPNNHFVVATIKNITVRIHRMSYSGELAYELYIPSGYAFGVWEDLIETGKTFNLLPYGTEAMGCLRIEKGHVAGPEIDGRTTLKDLGLEGFASKKKNFSGSILRCREKLLDNSRPVLVGLEVLGNEGASSGSLLFAENKQCKGLDEGHVTSTTYSPAIGKNIALALLANGKNRLGETVQVSNFVGDSVLSAKVVSPHFFDPTGERQNA